MTNDLTHLDALRASEQRLALALRAARMVVYEWDLITDHSTVNQRFREIFGLSDDAPLHGSAWLTQAVHPDSRATMDAAFKHAFSPDSDGAFEFEFRVTTPNGADVWVLTAGQATFAGDGAARRAVRVFGTGVDITAQKATEAAVRASEERLRTFVRATSDSVYEMSADWHQMYALDGKAFIATTDEPRANWIETYIPEDEQPRVWSAIHHAIATRSTFALEHRVMQLDGTVGWTFSRAIPILNDAGDIVRWFGTASDITERLRADERLRASEAKYRTLFNSMDEGVSTLQLIFDETEKVVDFRYLEHNPAITRQTGLGSDIVGKRVSAVFPDLEPYWLEAYERVAKTGEPERREYYFVTLDSWFDIYISCVGAKGSDQVCCVYNNITERKHRESTAVLLNEIGKDLSVLVAPEDIMQAVGERLGVFLGATACIFTDADEAANEATIHHGWNVAGVSSLKQTFRLAEYFGDEFRRAGRAGEVSIVSDTGHAPRANATAYAALGIGAFVTVPFQRHGCWVANMTVTSRAPRDWHPDDIGLLQEVAGRVFPRIDRARVEAALRASEEKYATLFQSSPAPFLVITPDAPRFTITEVNDTYLAATRRTRDTVIGRGIFEAYPDNPDDATSAGVHTLRASLERVLATRQLDALPSFKYDVARPDGTFEERWWSPVNAPVLDAHGAVATIIHNANEVTDLHRAEAAERERQDAQAFLLKLSDTLRAEIGAEAVGNRAVHMIAERLCVDRAYLVTLIPGDDTVVVTHEARREDMPPLRGFYRGSDFPSAVKDIFERTIVYNDVNMDTRLTELDRLSFAGLGAVGFIAAPIRRGSEAMIWAAGALSTQPRIWTATEIALFEDAIERTWAAVERARAEAALRASEAKYRTLFESIDEGYCLVELLLDAEGQVVDLLHLEANLVYEQQTGLQHVMGKRLREVIPDAQQDWLDFYGSVALTGQSARTEYYVADIGRWFISHASRVGGEGSHHIAIVFDDITERKLREQQQHFVLQLSDALRPLRDPVAVQETAMQMLGAHLGVNRAFYSEVLDDENTIVIAPGYANGVASLAGPMKFSAFDSDMMHNYRAGQMIILNDICANVQFTEKAKTEFDAMQTQAAVGVPLVKDGKVRAILSVHQAVPRTWTAAEVTLLKETAERTWAAVERARAEQAVQRSEARFRTLADAVPQVIWTNLADGTANYFNQRWFSYSGLSLNESFGPGWQAIVHSDDAPASVERWSHALAAGTVFDTEYRLRRADGAYRWHLGRNVPLHDADARVVGWFGSATDIDDLKHAEHAVREAAERLHIAIAAAAMGTWDWYIRTDEVYWNERYFRLFGMEPTTGPIHADAFFSRLHRDDRAWVMEQLRRAIHDAVIFDAEFRVVHDDGVVRWMRGYGQAVETIDGATTRMSGVMLDITDQKQAEVALQRANAELEARVAERTTALAATNEQLRQEIGERQQLEAQRTILLERIITAQEAERQRIAHELHDTLGQLLSALNLRLFLAQSLEGTLPTVQAELAQLQTLTRRVDQEVDRLTMELRPPALEHLGIGAALRSYAAEWTTTSGVPVDVLVTGLNDTRLAPVIENTMYRVAQEALSNVLKYAQATAVSLIIERRADALQLIIEDDGVGFAPHQGAVPGTGGRHVGLIGMAERATLAGGDLTIESELGVGTTIYLHLPVRPSTAPHGGDAHA